MNNLVDSVFVDEHFTHWLPVLRYALELGEERYYKHLIIVDYFKVIGKSVELEILDPNDPIGKIYMNDRIVFILIPLLHLSECIKSWFCHEVSWHPKADAINKILLAMQVNLVTISYNLVEMPLYEESIDVIGGLLRNAPKYVEGHVPNFKLDPSLKHRYPNEAKGLW